MTYISGYYYAPHYEFTNRNQHGERFKRISSKQLCTLELSCERTNASDLEDLIIFSHTLNTPVHYDFDANRASIKIMSAQAVEEAL